MWEEHLIHSVCSNVLYNNMGESHKTCPEQKTKETKGKILNFI